LFKPKLALKFDEREGCISKTCEFDPSGTKVGEARYIRVKVTNESRLIAREARAYLTNIEKRKENGNFGATEYCDSIPLAWSCQGKTDRFKQIGLPKDVNQFVDVIVTREKSAAFDPQVFAKPYRYVSLFNEKGIFRFTIQVSAAGPDPATIKLVLDWRGVWDDFAISVDE
jgi:hypothetical protein